MKRLINLLRAVIFLPVLLVSGCASNENILLNGDERQTNNLRSLIRSQLSDVRHLLGNEVSGECGLAFYRVYSFDTGLRVGVGDRGTIAWLFVEYGQDNQLSFHFDGIDGTSAYDDVAAAFGSYPDLIREGIDEYMVGAVKSYGYWVFENGFVGFFFDDDNGIRAISLMLAEMPHNL